jgi:uncharacterized protein YndB with AHSA1/START domain
MNSLTLEVAAPPDRVYWAYTADIRQWQTEIRRIAGDAPRDRAGTRWSAQYSRPFRIHVEVLEADAPRRHCERIAEFFGLLTCVTTATFDPSQKGTRLTLRTESRCTGPLDALLGGFVQSEASARFTNGLVALRRLAEH